MGDDFLGDLYLTAMASMVTSALELSGFGEIVQKLRNGGDLIGFFRHAPLRQHEPCCGGVGAERVQGLGSLAPIMGPSCRLAVDGDELGPIRPCRRHPAFEAVLEQDRIDPIEQDAQPAFAGNAMVERRETAQKIQMMPNPP